MRKDNIDDDAARSHTSMWEYTESEHSLSLAMPPVPPSMQGDYASPLSSPDAPLSTPEDAYTWEKLPRPPSSVQERSAHPATNTPSLRRSGLILAIAVIVATAALLSGLLFSLS